MRQLVVGLGNPGPRYAGTRHNAGYLVVELLAERLGVRLKGLRGVIDVSEGHLGAEPVVLGRPRSFMNESGGPIAAAARFYKVPAEQVIVVHDELDLPFGALRLKRGGGDGGHNGLKSMSASLASREYARVRFGIGRPPGRQDPADFVLSAFSTAERKELDYFIDRAADAVEAIIADGLVAAQNNFND